MTGVPNQESWTEEKSFSAAHQERWNGITLQSHRYTNEACLGLGFQGIGVTGLISTQIVTDTHP